MKSKFYKYTEQKYLENFFKSGELRIGTLYDYQNIEKHENDIGDPKEGSVSANKIINWHGGPHNQPEFDKQFFNVTAEDIGIHNVAVKKISSSQNLYIFSLSSSCSSKIMERMNSKYNACYCINNPKEFLIEISKSFGRRVKKSVFRSCIYDRRDKPHDQQHSIHPAWIKEPVHTYQNEYRLIIETWRSEIEPKLIYCPQAIKYCSVVVPS